MQRDSYSQSFCKTNSVLIFDFFCSVFLYYSPELYTLAEIVAIGICWFCLILDTQPWVVWGSMHMFIFFLLFFASALAALLLSSWFIDSLSWVLSEKHGEGMTQTHIRLLQHAPESQHQTLHKGTRSFPLVYFTWYFGFSFTVESPLKNYCQESGWYLHGILIKEELFLTLPMCLQSY